MNVLSGWGEWERRKERGEQEKVGNKTGKERIVLLGWETLLPNGKILFTLIIPSFTES